MRRIEKLYIYYVCFFILYIIGMKWLMSLGTDVYRVFFCNFGGIKWLRIKKYRCVLHTII